MVRASPSSFNQIEIKTSTTFSNDPIPILPPSVQQLFRDVSRDGFVLSSELAVINEACHARPTSTLLGPGSDLYTYTCHLHHRPGPPCQTVWVCLMIHVCTCAYAYRTMLGFPKFSYNALHSYSGTVVIWEVGVWFHESWGTRRRSSRNWSRSLLQFRKALAAVSVYRSLS
jgi:hypothetical protein